jgi:hypothetical protein
MGEWKRFGGLSCLVPEHFQILWRGYQEEIYGFEGVY